MLICCQPVFDCVAAVQADGPKPGQLVMLTPQGRRLDHQLVTELAAYERLLLDVMDAFTITWVRFLTAAALLGIWLAWRARLPALTTL